MAQVMPWGGEYRLIGELGLPQNQFTLNNATLGVLNGNCYIGGRAYDDLTDRVLSIDVSRGRHDQFQDFQASTMAITLSNNDRELDPVNESSRYWDPVTGTSGVTIRRKMTLYYGTTAIFTGLITDIDISYDPTSAPNTRSTVQISVADNFVILANTYLDEFVPTNQLSGARVNAILNLPEVDYQGTTSIDAGTVTCLDDPIAVGTRALDALQAVAATERGYLYMSGSGVLTFTDRVIGSPTLEKLFADDGTGTEYSSLSIVYGQENLFNRVICTPIDSVNPGTAENATSIATFGVSALSINNLLFSDAAAQDLAEYMLELYQLPSYRFDGMTIIFAGNQVSLVDQAEIIALDLGDTVKINKTFSIGSPSQIYQNVTIEHIDHRISPQAHEITYRFSPASFSSFTKTATGSGTGSQTAVGLHIAGRTASGSGSATTGNTGVGLHVAPRTATGTGTGTQTAVGLHLSPRTATGSGAATTGDVGVGLHIAPRTATGLGTGTQIVVKLHVAPRVATGTSTSGSSVSTLVARIRTATGSGTGSSAATGTQFIPYLILDSATNGILNTNVLSPIGNMPRTATGSGSGAGTAIKAITKDRTATGSGTGTGTAIKVIYTAPSSVDYLVVAGGGGASGGAGGGGGAGGMRQASSFAVSGTLTVTVGGGGTGGGSYPAGGYSASGAGSNSVFSSITSTGGGSSGGQNDVATGGGSGGGGGGGTNQPSQQTAGTGTSGQGNNGAAGIWNNRGGGGGGAGAAGSVLTGGAGAVGTITGTTYAGGGGAGGYTTWGYGGSGGGGTGTSYSDVPTAGGINLGGGGGGGGESNPGSGFQTGGGGAGGSGIVIIRYSNSYKDLTSISAGLTYTKTTPSGYIVYTFTAGTGTITI